MKVSIKNSLSLIFVAVLMIGFNGSTIVSYALANNGMVFLLPHQTALMSETRQEQARDLFQQATRWQQNNSTSLRGLALYYWQSGNDGKAWQNWQQLALTADEYIVFAQQSDSVSTRFRWYQLAWQDDSDSAALWLEVGRFCRFDMTLHQLCSLFLEYNNQNLLVDAELAFAGAVWKFNRGEGIDYDFVECPDLVEKKCARVVIHETSPQPQSSWQQCLHLEPDHEYHYSVWLKVDVAESGQWRPLYFQGNAAGKPHGIGQAVQTGDADWQYWESTFRLPIYEQGRVCFHPVLLQTVGQSWFHSARVSRVGW